MTYACINDTLTGSGWPTWTNVDAIGIPLVLGNRVTVHVDGEITDVAYFNHGGEVTARDLFLWDSSNTLVWQQVGGFTPPGLSVFHLTSSFAVHAGETWTVAYQLLSGTSGGQADSPTAVLPGGGFATFAPVYDTCTGCRPTTAAGAASPIMPVICGDVNYCAYGGENDPSKTLGYVVTDAMIDLVVGLALGITGQVELIPYVTTALAAIEGTIPFGINCAIVPTGGAALDLTQPWTLSPDNLLAWFKLAAWNWFCQCTPAPPGSPDPIDPIPPPVIAPPGVDLPAPTILCDNTNICSYLNHLEILIGQIGTQLSYLRTDVRSIQRIHVPFGYAPGFLHSGLTGAGQFSVSGILGLSVQITTLPGSSGEESGDPVARFGLGWITTGTAAGWRKSVPIRHNPQWVDAQPDDTLVGYSLAPLVVANIQEENTQP